MSSPTESEPQSSAEPSTSVETKPENTTAESTAGAAGSGAAEGEAARKSHAIRIGTQRYGVKPPTAIATPVLPAPPAELLAKAAALTAGEAGEGEAATAPAGEQPQQPAKPAGGPGKKPRHEKSKSVKPIAELAAPRKYPPPNIRTQLTPEMELELMEALGGESLDEIIAGGTPGATVSELEAESKHTATVVQIHRDNVFLDLGGAQQGILRLQDFAAPPEPGTTLEVVVTRFNAGEGLYELTLPNQAVDVGDWSEVAEGMLVLAHITGHNKGGLECTVNQLRGFIPASQVSMYRVEDLSQFADQRFNCVITEANPSKRNLVLSRRAAMEREQADAKEKLLVELEVGQLREGTVRSLQPFGAFVDLGGVDGLIHISQMSWDRVKHPSEVLEVGQRVKVKIQKIDPETNKIGLALRDLTENPWTNVERDFPTRSRVKGTVTRLMEFGAFVRLGPGVEGLVHISELSHKRVFRVSDVLTEGQEVEVMVLAVDAEQQRISLSTKALESRAVPEAKVEDEATAEPEAPAAPPKKRKVPLKGGTGGPPSGDRFGLKW